MKGRSSGVKERLRGEMGGMVKKGRVQRQKEGNKKEEEEQKQIR